ncbi:uncharacterized protein DUF2804 [Pseudoduganella flava]|uniref:DUF2804 family protein n=1 Tax=Pseudoduganella flava TaxID=871742 RepID=A0A562Q077_9BURK|nr:DUF2804 domain-containing protein [Pseudoduganella flava]QGZ38689.1 DUF2804 family protein [Pseudoduganella flava]TWI49736.1 uncharacterized protein DUF2804 [Pseudoduganella flava]
MNAAHTILPPAPACIVGPDGMPALGRHAGTLRGCDWHRLAPPYARGALWRRLHHKRWHYAALASDQMFCAVAIVDVGWMTTCFAYAFDRADGDMMANFSQDGLPGRFSATLAEDGAGTSTFGRAGVYIDLGPQGLSLRSPWLEVDASFAAPTAPALVASGVVAGGGVHATQKTGGLALTGEVRTWRNEYSLDGGTASIDYSNGLLPRETAWRWASGHDLDVGFNVQAGYFGANENALWLDGAVHPLAPARFVYDAKDPLEPWRIFTEDDCLDLVFTPVAARREQRNLRIAASRYVQPLGTFTGWVRSAPDAPRRIVTQLAGVTEQHFARW